MRSGLEAYRQGSLAEAGASWLTAARGFSARGDGPRAAEALNRAAQVRAALGFNQEAAALFARALEAAPEGRDALRATILGPMSANLADLGHPEAADRALEEALAHARKAGDPALESRLLHDRAERRLARSQAMAAKSDPEAASRSAAAAVEDERRSLELAQQAGDALGAEQARAGMARAALAASDATTARTALDAGSAGIEALPPSDAKARLWIHVGSTWQRLAETTDPPNAEALRRAAAAWQAAHEVAVAVGSRESASWSLGHLGALEERYGDPEQAVVLTRRAIASGQPLGAPELDYRWQWQLARLHRRLDDDAAALVDYRRAVAALDEMRADNAATGLDFGRAVEPVYYGLVDLLLRRAADAAAQEPRVALLTEARDELEKLKSAELTEYFQDECVAPDARTSATAIAGAAVIYPVVLPDRTELLLSGTGELTSVIVDAPRESLDATVRSFRESLPLRTSRAYRRQAAALYDLLIRPIEDRVLAPEIDTLVFVPGGSLRTIPMAALYDRETREFLIEKRPVAVIPALTLTEPRSLDREKVNTLRAGLTEGVQGFTPLEAVGSELEAVQEVFGGRALVNADFVQPEVASTLGAESFGIVHIATHGQFSARAEDSFLLTWDGRIDLTELSQLVERTRYQEEPIELLTLSACETAVGDDRAALGLAGVAVRAGARSALATLWTVNDQASADLVAEFYRQLAEPGTSKAQALQRAQLSLLETRTYRHPGYWAAFLMISNWM